MDHLILQEIAEFGAASTESIRRAWYTRRLKPPQGPKYIRQRLSALVAKRQILPLERDSYGHRDGTPPTVAGMGKVWGYLYPEIMDAIATRPSSYWGTPDIMRALRPSPDRHERPIRRALIRLMRYGHLEPMLGGRLAFRLTRPVPAAAQPHDVFA